MYIPIYNVYIIMNNFLNQPFPSQILSAFDHQVHVGWLLLVHPTIPTATENKFMNKRCSSRYNKLNIICSYNMYVIIIYIETNHSVLTWRALNRSWCSNFLMPSICWNMSYNCSFDRIASLFNICCCILDGLLPSSSETGKKENIWW